MTFYIWPYSAQCFYSSSTSYRVSVRHPSSFNAKWYSILWIYHLLLICSLSSGLFGGLFFTFLLLWIVLLWMFVFKYVFESLFELLYVYTQAWIAQLWGNSRFNLLRSCRTVFHLFTFPSGSAHRHQHLLHFLRAFFICFSRPSECESDISLVLTCISHVTKDVGLLSMCLWPFVYLGEMFIQVLCPCVINWFVLRCSVVNVLYI